MARRRHRPARPWFGGLDEIVCADQGGRIRAGGAASDEEFIRRVYLDLTGAIPRVAEVREFLADERADKRASC